MINGILLGVCIGMLLVAIIALAFSVMAYSKVVGFENSTHQVQYMDPFQEGSEEDGEEEAPQVVSSVADPKSTEDKKFQEKKEENEFERKAILAFTGKKADTGE